MAFWRMKARSREVSVEPPASGGASRVPGGPSASGTEAMRHASWCACSRMRRRSSAVKPTRQAGASASSTVRHASAMGPVASSYHSKSSVAVVPSPPSPKP